MKDSTPERAGPMRAGPPRRRRWAIRLALATLLPLSVLGLAEAGLRLAGVGHPAGFFVPAEGIADALAPNPRFGWSYFPRAIARRPEAFALPAKAPGTLRVFVLGSSAAQGFPDPGIGIARLLEVLLRERFPGARFEVLNAAMVAINSHAVVDIARDCATEGEGDVFVVYEGNNEVIGPFGPGTVFAGFTPNRAMIRASLLVRRLRLGQLLAELRGGEGPLEWTGMELFLGNRIAADDPRLARTAEHFRANLTDVCRAATSRGKAVVLCTVGVNLRDCAPFASLHRDDLGTAELAAWDAAFAAGSEAEAAGRHAEALEHYARAAASDERHAELRFRSGRCLLALGRTDEARAEFAAARDLDALRFRTDRALNEVVREVAASEGAGVRLVDVERLMESPAASPHGIPGSELFLEHCHMTLAGNSLIARAVLDALLPLLPAELRAASPEVEAPSLERCAELLGLSPWHAARIAATVTDLMERPPFTFQAAHEASLADARARAAGLLAAARPADLAPWIQVFERELAGAPEDWTLRRRFGDVLAAAGDFAGAEAQFRAVVGAVPFDVDAGHALARVLLLGGDVEGASGEYRRVLASSWSAGATRAETCLALAQLEEERGRIDVAVTLCAEALEEHPSNARALAQLGHLHMRRQRWAEAERWLRAAIEAGFTAARLDLARVLAAQRRIEEASVELTELVRLEPGDTGAWIALGDAQSSLGRSGEALTSYATAARLAPGAAETRVKLGNAYLAAGRLDEAVAELTEAARLRPDLPGVQASLRAARERRARDP